MILESKNFKLRPWQDNDAESLAEVANNKKIFDNLRDGFPHPYTLEDAKNWITSTKSVNDPLVKLFAIDIEGKAVGSIGISLKEDVYRMNAEIGYFIGEPYWNRGIITKTIKLLVEYIFATFDVIRIYAEPYSNNIASQRALEKAGFRCEAIFHQNVIKNGEILDSCIYSILKKDIGH
jgi:RimJ/RimL family protein N-acetyltransferase